MTQKITLESAPRLDTGNNKCPHSPVNVTNFKEGGCKDAR